MILSDADETVRALIRDLGERAAAGRLGLALDGLIEAAEGRSARLFWAVSEPNQHPGPATHAALAGAWLHGALCAAAARSLSAPPPARAVDVGDLMEAVQAFEAQCDETGDSRVSLARHGMVRAELQPRLAALAPDRAVAALCAETGAPSEACRNLLGVFALDGAVVTRDALERVARDPGPTPAHIAASLGAFRLHRTATELMQMSPITLDDLIDRDRA